MSRRDCVPTSPPVTLLQQQARLDDHVLHSPSGLLRFEYETQENAGGLVYSIHSVNRPVILKSQVAFSEDCGQGTGWSDLRVTKLTRGSANVTWSNVFGERASIPDRYNQLRIGLSRSPVLDHSTEFELQVRAYDEGVAFRFVLLEHMPRYVWHNLSCEQVEFNMPNGATAYRTRFAQAVYEKKALTDWAEASEPPLTLELADGQWVSILEAAQVDFAHMKLALIGDEILRSVHRGPVTIPHLPYEMPWRVVMVANKPGDLLEHNYIVLNLNPPSALQDTSWIRPGRVLRLMAFYKDHAMIRRQIAFALDQNLTYIHLDAGWYGDEYDPASDATQWNVSRLDLPYLISHAKANALGVILYVNHLALERQMDVIFPLYRKWGVDGVKFGFVHVGPQNWTVWLHEAIQKAAEHGLMVDVHDDYRPTGFSRTYPNLLQIEGIYGDEAFPSANQSTIYPFTRFLAGPADHTYCFLNSRLKKSKAHQLALTVVNFGPLQYLHWYDRLETYDAVELGEVEFWKDLPTVWDDTRVLDAEPGEFVAIARRSGNTWWVGALTNERARDVQISLAFLLLDGGSGSYEAWIHEDADPKTISKRTIILAPSDLTLNLVLRESGGVAIRMRSVASM